MLCEHNRPISDCSKCHKIAPSDYDDTDHAFYTFDDGTPFNDFALSDDSDAWAGITAS